MSSRPPPRRPPSRSPPPPPPPAASSASPSPSTTTGGKIIRLSQRPGDSIPAPSRADVTLPKSHLRPSPSSIRSLKRPAPSAPRDPNLQAPSTAASVVTSSPPRRRDIPPAWKRRVASENKKPPPPEDDKPKDATVVAEAAKPQAPPDKDTAAVEVSTPAVDRNEKNTEATVEATAPVVDQNTQKTDAAVEASTSLIDPNDQKPEAKDLPEPLEDADMDQAEDDLSTAFKTFVVEHAKYSQAQDEWLCEAIRGIRDDITKVAESGDHAVMSQLLKMATELLIEPAEGHLKVITEAEADIDALVDRIRKEHEEAAIDREGDDDANTDREGDEVAVDA